MPFRSDRPESIVRRMTRRDIEDFIGEVMNALPAWVGEGLVNVEILVLEAPDAELDPDGSGLLGLYSGVPLTERGANDPGEFPDVIYIFRQPHLALGLPPDELRDEIATTLIHELALYYGIDDDHLDELGWG